MKLQEFVACFVQENCNVLVSNDYSEKTRRSMAMLSEKEHSFELIEVSSVNNVAFAVAAFCDVKK